MLFVQDVFKYMKLGVGVELLKVLASNIDRLRADPIRTIVSLPQRMDCDLPAFLITYCGLYRVSFDEIEMIDMGFL